jgi:hypothetical protein
MPAPAPQGSSHDVVIASAYHDMKYEKRLDLTSPKA